MSDGNTGNTEKALEDISLETATQTSTVETRKNRLVLQIADVCFEMFSVRELRKPVAVLRELSAAFPEAPARIFKKLSSSPSHGDLL